MLTADLVRARKKAGELQVSPLKGKTKARALELSAIYMEVTEANIGQSREDVRAAWTNANSDGKDKRLADGLLKLIDDACDFEAETDMDPIELRGDVFLKASADREALDDGGEFNRQAVLDAVAKERGQEPDVVERGLYTDLNGAQILQKYASVTPEVLVERYETSTVQAVLLRAASVRAEVYCSNAGGYRAVFRALKFRRLLYTVTPLDEDDPKAGYLLDISGPYALFGSNTKYGLQLALVLPVLLSCDRLKLVANVRWGKQRTPLSYGLEHKRKKLNVAAESNGLPEEVQTLLTNLAKQKTKWTAKAADKIVDLPGVGLCVPDLEFVHESGERVLLEVLGYWSRDAVWKRVELVEAGLPERWLFAVRKRLRVSEEVLDGEEHGALYVYKGVMSARAILKQLDAML